MTDDNELDLHQIMERMQTVRQELMLVQSDLSDAEVKGSAGGGLVTVTMRGNGEVTAVRFEQSAIDEGDAGALAAMTLAALRHATDEVKVLTTERMAVITDGLEASFLNPEQGSGRGTQSQ